MDQDSNGTKYVIRKHGLCFINTFDDVSTTSEYSEPVFPLPPGVPRVRLDRLALPLHPFLGR